MTFLLRRDVQSWGRVIRTPQRVAAPRFREDLAALIAARPDGSVLPIGMRLSYGDSPLNSQGGVIAMTGMDRLLALDETAGTLRAEAGVTLSAILQRVVPKGFFLPVTPGTRYVTLGGAIANDVHGKNHHRAGTFGRHVLRLGLLRSDGTRTEIGPDKDRGLFAATVGGLGLTGVIEWAEIELKPIAGTELDVEVVPFGALSEFWDLGGDQADAHEHTVAWIDCAAKGHQSGRGIFSRANWSAEAGLVVGEDRRRLSVPLDAPGALLNRWTVGRFNSLYYTMQKRKAGAHRQHYASFFYPLDGIAQWNRLYGRRGFWQYQCVVPPTTMRDAIAALLEEVARSGQGSFLAVLKTFGDVPSPGMLSFPMPGATLALDFPNRGETTLALFSRLDAIVRESKGRLYAAKDGRIPKDMWAAGYPRMPEFVAHVDPAFASDFWRRVGP